MGYCSLCIVHGFYSSRFIVHDLWFMVYGSLFMGLRVSRALVAGIAIHQYLANRSMVHR